MIDYGAVVKKNGKIISNVKGGLFQNFTNLKYETMEEEPYNTIVDETVVSFKTGEKVSFAGNYFAVVGDEQLMIGFYKTHIAIAVDKVWYNYPYIDWLSFDSQYKCTHFYKPKYINVNKGNEILTTIKVKPLDEESSVYVATFVYKGDKYEVMYGYGVDTSVWYTFGDNNYYEKGSSWRWHYHTTGAYKFRKTLKRMRYWYFSGLSDELKEKVKRLYKYNGKL